MLLLAIDVFFVGSALSATAVNMAMLIAGRTVQGLGGGGLVNLSNIVIADLFSMRYALVWMFIVDQCNGR